MILVTFITNYILRVLLHVTFLSYQRLRKDAKSNRQLKLTPIELFGVYSQNHICNKLIAQENIVRNLHTPVKKCNGVSPREHYDRNPLFLRGSLNSAVGSIYDDHDDDDR